MAFTFGFSGDDFSDDANAAAAPGGPRPAAAEVPAANAVSMPPQTHALDALLQSLVDTRVTFDTYQTPAGNAVFRRQLFDIKHQAMTEDEDDAESEVHKILVGSSSDEVDVRKNVYEGGFKSWECSYDLVDKLDVLFKQGSLDGYASLLELGCGTALPSCYLLQLLLRANHSVQKIVLSDFNYEVLRLVTLPNLIIHWASTLSHEDLDNLLNKDIPLNNDELIFTPALLDTFKADLHAKNIELVFISGAWGPQFLEAVKPHKPDFLLSSETIYSLETLPVVVSTILSLFNERERFLALVAAKVYYFGVGGSIREFLDQLDAQKPSNMNIDTVGDGVGQLKRNIVRISN